MGIGITAKTPPANTKISPTNTKNRKIITTKESIENIGEIQEIGRLGRETLTIVIGAENTGKMVGIVVSHRTQEEKITRQEGAQ